MNKNIYLFCEGNDKSLDKIVLNSLQPKGKVITVQPFGGVRGYTPYIEGFSDGIKDFVGSLGTAYAMIAFRDRDFDYPVPHGVPTLIRIKPTVFAGYRTTIENYLLDSEVLFKFARDRHIDIPFASVETMKESAFDQAARDIAYFQAARYALGSITNNKAQQKQNFKSNKGGFLKSGDLPSSLDMEDCRSSAHQVISEFQGEAQKYSIEAFDAEFQRYAVAFSDPSFISEGKYLIYFQGKDLATAMKKYLPSFPFETYYKTAAKNFDSTKFEDLVEFKRILEEL